MEKDLLRKDVNDRGRKRTKHKFVNDSKFLEESGNENQKGNSERTEETMDVNHVPATTGFQNVKVIGKTPTDKLFDERLKAHKSEVDAFLAKHSELRMER